MIFLLNIKWFVFIRQMILQLLSGWQFDNFDVEAGKLTNPELVDKLTTAVTLLK